MKKVFSLVLTLVLMLVLSISASASPAAPIEGPSSTEDAEFTILDTIYIDASHSGKTGYDKTFSISSNSDKTLNVWVKNNGSSSVKFFVEHIDSKTEYSTETVSAGSQLTRTFSLPSGGYLYGQFRVYVYTTSGSEMNIDVRARGY